MRWIMAWTLLALALPAAAQDRDKDGLSDFVEAHKYFTNPDKADSDGDGVPDGDRDERREYTYTIRTVVQVMHPAAAISDDYQDARVLDRTDEYVELEVIHYPLNTVAEGIRGNAGWRLSSRIPHEYVESTITSNWDEGMRDRLVAELKGAGIDVTKLDDKSLVEQASKWLVRRTKAADSFTTFFVHFPDGRAEMLPALATKKTDGMDFERELFAKGMFTHKTRGSCTSSAIYLAGCLRALSIPTRIVLCIPVVDASDGNERRLVERNVRHHGVRHTILTGLPPERSWSSHTFNEVWVGGRWRRLNYSTLGQNTLDARYFGLMTHVLTVRDWADANVAKTIGLRQGLHRTDDAFGHRNPYSTIALSDRFGKHARIENQKPKVSSKLTIERAVWNGSPGHPVGLLNRITQPGGHVLMKVKENKADGGTAQYAPFWKGCDKAFALEASGQPEVLANAERGYWADGWFYLRIPPDQLGRMKPGVKYTLVPRNKDTEFVWAADGATLTRARPPGEQEKRAVVQRLTIAKFAWYGSEDHPKNLTKKLYRKGGHLLMRVAENDGTGTAQYKEFWAGCDKEFTLRSDGHRDVSARAIRGYWGNGWFHLYIAPDDLGRMEVGVPYTVVPRNEATVFRWSVAGDTTLTRSAR